MSAVFFIPAIAAALLVGGELTFGPRRALGRQLGWLGAAALGAIASSSLVLLGARVAVGRSVGLTVAGMAAAVAAIALLRTLLGRR